jgi:hypothetical protein
LGLPRISFLKILSQNLRNFYKAALWDLCNSYCLVIATRKCQFVYTSNKYGHEISVMFENPITQTIILDKAFHCWQYCPNNTFWDWKG